MFNLKGFTKAIQLPWYGSMNNTFVFHSPDAASKLLENWFSNYNFKLCKSFSSNYKLINSTWTVKQESVLSNQMPLNPLYYQIRCP